MRCAFPFFPFLIRLVPFDLSSIYRERFRPPLHSSFRGFVHRFLRTILSVSSFCSVVLFLFPYFIFFFSVGCRVFFFVFVRKGGGSALQLPKGVQLVLPPGFFSFWARLLYIRFFNRFPGPRPYSFHRFFPSAWKDSISCSPSPRICPFFLP